MNSLSAGILVVLGLIVAGNYRNGTLGDWLRAKFLNASAPPPASVRRSGAIGGSSDQVAPGPFPGDDGSGVGGQLATFRPGGLTPPLPSTYIKGEADFGEQRPGHRHAGEDWPAPAGTPVFATAPGRVVSAGAAGAYGLRVDVDHGGGWVTRYAHLSRLGVGVGDVLSAGDVLGAVGSTGRSTGNHLHWEVLRNGQAVDPIPFLGSALPPAPGRWV